MKLIQDCHCKNTIQQGNILLTGKLDLNLRKKTNKILRLELSLL